MAASSAAFAKQSAEIGVEQFRTLNDVPSVARLSDLLRRETDSEFKQPRCDVVALHSLFSVHQVEGADHYVNAYGDLPPRRISTRKASTSAKAAFSGSRLAW